jgi:hypothetical protein
MITVKIKSIIARIAIWKLATMMSNAAFGKGFGMANLENNSITFFSFFI